MLDRALFGLALIASLPEFIFVGSADQVGWIRAIVATIFLSTALLRRRGRSQPSLAAMAPVFSAQR
jgi:hypothetical protein